MGGGGWKGRQLDHGEVSWRGARAHAVVQLMCNQYLFLMKDKSYLSPGVIGKKEDSSNITMQAHVNHTAVYGFVFLVEYIPGVLFV